MASCILIGPPGCGKGTQRERLVKKYGFATIVPGDLMREEIKNKTSIGLQLEDCLTKGLLAPHELAMHVVEKKLTEYNKTGVKHILFDGFPREIEQAIAIDKSLHDICKDKFNIKCAILFEVSDDTAIKRIYGRSLYSGRADDSNDDVIHTRLKLYHEKIVHVVDKYRQQCILHVVDGEPNIDIVATALDHIINDIFA